MSFFFGLKIWVGNSFFQQRRHLIDLESGIYKGWNPRSFGGSLLERFVPTPKNVVFFVEIEHSFVDLLILRPPRFIGLNSFSVQVDSDFDVSNKQKPWLSRDYIRDYTTQLCGDYKKPV